jgi:hypothetical protein
MDWKKAIGSSSALGALGSIFGAMGSNGFNNPQDAAKPYIDQIPNSLHPYYDPYIQRGERAGNDLEGKYSQMMNDPNGLLQQFGSKYTQSPGFQFKLKQALQAADHAAAAGGMSGSPMHQQQEMQLANDIGNQDYNDYMSNIMRMYGLGEQGERNMYGMGYGASNEMGQSIGNALNSQAQLAYQGAQAKNQKESQDQGFWGSLAGGLGSLASFLL